METTRARQHLTCATRPPKTVRPLADLLAEWANRARALTGLEPRDLAARALAGAYGRALHAHDIGPEVRAAMVAQVLDDVSTRRSVWTTWNLGAAAVRASKLLRMASPAERRAPGAAQRDHHRRRGGVRAPGRQPRPDDAACRRVAVHLDRVARRGEGPHRRRRGTGAPHRPAEMLGAVPLRTEQHLGALAPGQRAAAEDVITSGRLLDVGTRRARQIDGQLVRRARRRSRRCRCNPL